MCNLVLVLLVALCSTSLVLCENISGNQGKGCTLPNQSRGICKPSSECLRNGTSSTECSNERGTVYVCCEPTETGSPSHIGTGKTIESPREVELNETSKTENGTNNDQIVERFFFFDEPISANWQNKDDRRGVQHNYNNFREEGRNPFLGIDLGSFEIVPADTYNLGGNKEEENVKYQWDNNRRRTERPFDQGYESYEKHGRKKYPWENNQRTTARPYSSILFHYEEKEDQKYQWNSNRRTTEWPYDEGYDSYEKHGRKKYPWEYNQRTTARPYSSTLFHYEEKEDQQYQWNSNRRTTERPYNPGYNYNEQHKEPNYPWSSNRRTTERPYNPAPNYEKEDQEYLGNSNRRTTERPRATRRTTESPPKKQTLDPNGFIFSDNEKRKRISKIKCDEYSEIVTQTISGLPLIPDPSPIKVKVDECKNFQSLIVGGRNAGPGEFPHMAAVGFFNSGERKIVWSCGGSLISDLYVLTAAHCTYSNYGKPVMVRLGDYNLKSEDDEAQPEDYRIADIIVHPNYKRSIKYYDIALLRLSYRVDFRKDIRPACLYTESNIRNSKATAIGWGRLHRAGMVSDILQKVSLDIIDNKSCRKPYNVTTNIKFRDALPRGIIESQLCAGDLSGKRDTCQGDSGGPLEILSDRNLCVHYIIGITSFGKSCATINSPGVYTRVSSYIPWIESVVWPEQ